MKEPVQAINKPYAIIGIFPNYTNCLWFFQNDP